ncbi:hypothetical protein BH23GEM10_BH23GEM10_01830 [soil metagenome]
MSHLTEGSVQTYLDGELDGAAQAELRGHLDSCAPCAADLAALSHFADVAGGALALLDTDVTVPVLRARAAIAAERRPAVVPTRRRRFATLSAAGLSRAAMLLLVLAGAGAAAIPGSPVRRALDATLTRVAQLFVADAPPAAVDEPAPEAPAAEVPVSRDWAAIQAADGRVRVQLHEPAGAIDVVVRLVDGPRANVQTVMEQGDVSFVSGTGRIEVVGLGTGSVVIEIPRTLMSASIQVGGHVHVYKDGETLQLTGPAGAGQGSEVRFRTGS